MPTYDDYKSLIDDLTDLCKDVWEYDCFAYYPDAESLKREFPIVSDTLADAYIALMLQARKEFCDDSDSYTFWIDWVGPINGLSQSKIEDIITKNVMQGEAELYIRLYADDKYIHKFVMFDYDFDSSGE